MSLQLGVGSASVEVRAAGRQPVEQRARQRPLVDLQGLGGPAHLHQEVDQKVIGALLSREEVRTGGIARLAEAMPLDHREGFLHEPASGFEIAAAARHPSLAL